MWVMKGSAVYLSRQFLREVLSFCFHHKIIYVCLNTLKIKESNDHWGNKEMREETH